jgi:membrane-associated PAP2 superfamily phosphatase
VKKQILIDFIIPGLLLLAATLLFIFTNLDIQLMDNFYKSDQEWIIKNNNFWNMLYKYSNIPALLMVFGSIAVLILSFYLIKYIKYRKFTLLIILTLFIGPGILINAVFKDHWGRPRPRQIEHYGGNEQFLSVWKKGISGKGKSFPCGHCSMGFLLIVPYFFLRKKHKNWAGFFLGFGIIYGIIIGIARMVQGGHFPSDVLWSGSITYFTAAALSYSLGIDKDEKTKMIHPKYKRLVTTAVIILSISMIIALLVATPYYKSKKLFIHDQFNKGIFEFDRGEIELFYGDKNHIIWQAHGFGFPERRLEQTWTMSNNTGYYKLKKKGWFSELNNNVNFQLLHTQDSKYTIKLKKGNIKFLLPEKNIKMDIFIQIDHGTLTLNIPQKAHFSLYHTVDEINNTSQCNIQSHKNNIYTDKNNCINITTIIENGSLHLIDLENE